MECLENNMFIFQVKKPLKTILIQFFIITTVLFSLCLPKDVYASIDIIYITKMRIKNIDNMLQVFWVDTRRFPSKKEGLIVLLENKNHISLWRGPYVGSKRSLQDYWGNKLNYHIIECENKKLEKPYFLYSSGANGIDEKGLEDDVVFTIPKNCDGKPYITRPKPPPSSVYTFFLGMIHVLWW